MSTWLEDEKLLHDFFDYIIKKDFEKKVLKKYKILSTYDDRIRVRLYYYNSQNSIYLRFSDKELFLIDFKNFIRRTKIEKIEKI